MKNKKITRKITAGMYVLTTEGGGCLVDAVSQISSGENPLISVSVMNSNYTNELLKKNQKFALSVLSMDASPDIITTFGMTSMRDCDKFQNISFSTIDGLVVLPDSLGYMICEIVDQIPNDTHTLFIGKLIEADMYRDEQAMSYSYYQEHKDDYVKVTTEKGKTAWVCSVCGYVYYKEELPEDFLCPVCKVDKSYFKKSDSLK